MATREATEASTNGKDAATAENAKQQEESCSSNLLFHPPAAHEEHSAGDSIKSEDEQEQDSEIVEIDAGIAAEMAVASNGKPVAEES